MSESEIRARHFTIDEANAMLPLVRAIVADLVDLASDVVERRQRLDHLLEGRDIGESDPYSQELAYVERELEAETERLRGFERELSDLGVELQSSTKGLIHFPALIDEREVYLCWKCNEPEVAFWHDMDAGYDDRQALTTLAG